ncbi:MAG: hypothetical protein QNJ46_25650 [Leptolyngbyaceae cyanobacterium MO_188.B28]|nr:hypothetical protein [Leptolyngbyaceae cyanobacterium MO_188.B28]
MPMLTLRRRPFRIVVLALFLISLLLPPALAQSSDSGASILNGSNGAMTSHGDHDPHMRMTSMRPPTENDLAKADDLAQKVKVAIAKYADISVAEADDYQPFPPDPSDLYIVHYVNVWLPWLENFRLDPKHPGSLLYERQADGSLQLLGAMFTAPPEATEEELNARVPLSVTRWHLHTNICVPNPIWDKDQWELEQDGQPVFGPESPIATESACESVGGDFWPTAFGWMVHANVFADEPADIWNPMYGHGEGVEG